MAGPADGRSLGSLAARAEVKRPPAVVASGYCREAEMTKPTATTDPPEEENIRALAGKAFAPLREKLEAQAEAEVSAVVESGRCSNLIPFPRLPSLPVRVELTLEQLPLFVVNAYKGESRTLTLTLTLEDGETVEQTFSVGAVSEGGRSYGVLKQTHQEAFYRLLHVWGERGYPLNGDGLGVLELTAYDLVVMLRGNDAEHHYRRAKELVNELASIPVSMRNVRTRRGVCNEEDFRLIHLDTWSERKVDTKTRRPKEGGHSKVRILFSRFVTDGFLRGHVKALMLGAYDSLGADNTGRRAEVARLLYPILDRELATKQKYHCRLTTLAERLGLVPQRYKSDRARPFAQAVRLLDGKPILGERHSMRVTLRESADGEDYVLEATRAAWQPWLPGVDQPPTPSQVNAIAPRSDSPPSL
jgi:hypothetical protein